MSGGRGFSAEAVRHHPPGAGRPRRPRQPPRGPAPSRLEVRLISSLCRIRDIYHQCIILTSLQEAFPRPGAGGAPVPG